MTLIIGIIIMCLILFTQKSIHTLGCLWDCIGGYSYPGSATPAVRIIRILDIDSPAVIRMGVSCRKVSIGDDSLLPINGGLQGRKLIVNLIPGILIIPVRLIDTDSVPYSLLRSRSPGFFRINGVTN